jgi:hypothetical protein
VSFTQVTEMVDLLENTFRAMGIKVWELLDVVAASHSD